MPELTWLEMNSLEWLRPSQEKDGLTLRAVSGDDVRSLTLRVGAPFAWPSQHLDDSGWAAYLADPAFRHWAPILGSEMVGILSLNVSQAPVYEIDSFGLVPSRIGQGLGGPFLSASLAMIWALPATRIWLHTSSDDHPHAMRNYLARGFCPSPAGGGPAVVG